MRFQATIELHGRTATAIEVPAHVVAALGAGPRPAVRVTIGDHAYRATVVRRGGRWVVPVRGEDRLKAGVVAGDVAGVHVELDTEPRAVAVPPDLMRAIDADPAVRTVFNALPSSGRRRHVRAVQAARSEVSRRRRIAKTVDALRAA